ncbi:TRAP transporter small permease subunit [Consotaella salsifontis]|uniref:TRAP transporter small permease protein n=1 Tax=Consotaella salsifontis TaxID=1365950 RepID=A0A1T4MNJ5_9HYPH|nr:TRAP transporter small permease [Consotaella salsifontis]SJZ68619.1 TRAP-type mannitol/chloroaromatic compound transport system, small permease component [Consotaella salsifontis]
MTNEPSLPDAVEPLKDEPNSGDPSEDGPITGLDRLIGLASRAIAWLVFIATAISVYEVFMRYALNSPTSWVHETTVFLISVIFALGGPIALARNKHIRVRILYDLAGPRMRWVLDIVNGVLTLVFTFGMTYAAWLMFFTASHNPLGEWQLERSGTSWNPPFPAITKGVILLAVAIMLVQALMHLFHTLTHWPRQTPAQQGGR